MRFAPKAALAESLLPQREPLVRLTALAGLRIGRRSKARGWPFKWLGYNFHNWQLNTIRVKNSKPLDCQRLALRCFLDFRGVL
jgi:hypothetical protein